MDWGEDIRAVFIWLEEGSSSFEASCSFPAKRLKVESKKELFWGVGALLSSGITRGPANAQPQAVASAAARPKLS